MTNSRTHCPEAILYMIRAQCRSGIHSQGLDTDALPFSTLDLGVLFLCFYVSVKFIYDGQREAVSLGDNHRNGEKILCLADGKTSFSSV